MEKLFKRFNTLSKKYGDKIIFAFKMDEVTAAKFLLANGHELLSLRNPLDYACRVCLKYYNFTYSNAETLFNKLLKYLTLLYPKVNVFVDKDVR